MKKLADTTKIAVGSLRNSSFWLINFGVIAVCFLSGPFGTLEALPSGFRLIYWGLIVSTTSVLAMWLHSLFRHWDGAKVLLIAVVSIGFGFLVAGIVVLLSVSLLNPIDRYPGHIKLISYSFPSAVVIFLLSALVMRTMSVSKNFSKEKRPALLERLERFPHAKHVLSLSAQDHYVKVTTDIGSELCLMRLSDAIAQVKPTIGFQIHRSHWVAKSAIREIDNNGTASKVHLIDGRSLSISHSRLPEFIEFLKNN
jgi:hypothetical protein